MLHRLRPAEKERRAKTKKNAKKKENEKQDTQRVEVEAARAELTAPQRMKRRRETARRRRRRRRRAPRGSRLVLLGFTGRM